MHILFCLACIAEYVKESSVLYFNYTLLNRKKKKKRRQPTCPFAQILLEETAKEIPVT